MAELRSAVYCSVANIQPPMPTSRAVPAANRTASRSLTGTGLGGVWARQSVARAPERLEVGAAGRQAQLAAQVADVLVNHVGGGLEGEIPHLRQDLGPGQDHARVTHEQLQQSELRRGQGYFRLAPPCP